MEPPPAALSLTLQHAVTGEILATLDELQAERDFRFQAVFRNLRGDGNRSRRTLAPDEISSSLTPDPIPPPTPPPLNPPPHPPFPTPTPPPPQESTSVSQLREQAASTLGLRDVTALRGPA